MVKAEAALRKEAEEVRFLEKEGHYELALERVDELAARHAGSALVLHLAGRTHHAAASRASAASDKVAATHHAAAAERYLAEAKRLVPNCVGISALLARVLLERGELGEADKEAIRAIHIRNPTDPADNNVVYTLNARGKNQRVERCWESACDVLRSIVASSIREVLDLDTDQSEGMTLAVEKATELANRCPYSAARSCCAHT
ncbi:uncharacterized protein LOC104584499 [Brachypodium distachyon]|uniref:uncharacterized protein LOC104584499 n=1 Tax=Brachypodium distachyon TaxID=15368 RepID=UPI00071DC664|nr:uncharacterized protein LOC104584499 [Brachypodium distachyon]XP_024319375.1 uncharacterized protein LOC104584499 [Brachypodium distachyon]|eukprot:XP_014757528.1 uncharacterized protein LOC104584499 [Brachypodium distachyon]